MLMVDKEILQVKEEIAKTNMSLKENKEKNDIIHTYVSMNDNLRGKIGEIIVNVEAIILKTKLTSTQRGKSTNTPAESAQEKLIYEKNNTLTEHNKIIFRQLKTRSKLKEQIGKLDESINLDDLINKVNE